MNEKTNERRRRVFQEEQNSSDVMSIGILHYLAVFIIDINNTVRCSIQESRADAKVIKRATAVRIVCDILTHKTEK